ncbi:DUF3137 domain-containing protein [Pelagibius sp. CAU 1746]|uniref:DUF3137 domain-containing protein n=1 Tax=Pelagibius sp. CAU 1746 TaxID=3140370 RepID=UPI00325BE9E0
MTETQTGAQASLAEVFAAEIAPHLPALEAARKGRLRTARLRAAGAGGAVILAAVVIWLQEVPAAAIAVLILGGAAGGWWALGPARRHKEAVRALFIPPLLRFLGETEHHRDPGGNFDLSRVERAGITGAFNRSKLEDLFIGRHRGTDFRMVEARLRRRSGGRRKRQTTVFKGLLCEVGVPVAFEGVVLLVGDKGALGNWVADKIRGAFDGVEAVTLTHDAFEARFQVYSDAPEDARRLLQPGLCDTLVALADELGRDAVNCAFIEGRFLVALPQKQNLFEIGRLHRSLAHGEEDLRRLAGEFTIPQRLIDTLHGERKQVLPES